MKIETNTHTHLRMHAHTYAYTHMYSRGHGKFAITIQRSPFERHSVFSVHGNDVHRFLAIWLAGQPFSEQTASDIIGYSLWNDWNAASGMPAIGKCLPSDRNAVCLAAPDVNAV